MNTNTQNEELSNEDIERILSNSSSNIAVDFKVKCTGSFIGAPTNHHPSFRTPEGFPKMGAIYLAKETHDKKGFILNGVPCYSVANNQDVGWPINSFKRL
jgi:hypothetical protein